MTGGAGYRGGPSGAPRRSRLLIVVAVALLLAGAAALAVGVLGQQSAPAVSASATGSESTPARSMPSRSTPLTTEASGTPSPSSAAEVSSPPPGSTSGPTRGTTAAPRAPVAPDRAQPAETSTTVPVPHGISVAEPVAVRVPAIDVDSELVRLGLNPDGTLEVPQPGPDYDRAGWFTGSPAPGAVGPAVIEGHIDSAANGPSVFFELGALKPGDTIEVDRADRSTIHFTVEKVASYPKDEFPTLEVYGNTAGPELRLITCGGDFDSGEGSYRDNTVVYARLNS